MPLNRLAEFDLHSSNLIEVSKDILFIKKENWDYEKSHNFQQEMALYLKENKTKQVWVLCNHPHCFTLGSGLQRNADKDTLKDFDPNAATNLTLPIHKIKRGGGITYHFPGQWIVYPLVNLNYYRTSVARIMVKLLDLTKNILEESHQITGLDYKCDLVGLWLSGRKLASVGMGLNRFITQHGLALNLEFDQKMKDELKKINPCGMSSNIYTSVKEIDNTSISFDEFCNHFLEAAPYFIKKSKLS